jgi:HEAT repeat protein
MDNAIWTWKGKRSHGGLLRLECADVTASSVWLLAMGTVLFVLVLCVLGRKVVRDSVELRCADRRARLARALARGDSRPLRTAVAGSRRVQEDAIAVLRAPRTASLPAGVVPGSLIRQLKSRRVARRGRAVVLLGLLEAREAVGEIAELLSDRDPDVRLATASALEALGEGRLTYLLIDALERGLLSPIQVIERIAHPWAVEAILAGIADLSPGARAAVWRAAGLAGVRAAVPALCTALRAGTGEERISAARALGELAAVRAQQDLIGALDDSRWEVRAQAATALGRLGEAAGVPILEAAMTDPTWWVRANAANALARLDSEGAAALARVRRGPDAYAADLANEALQGISL